MGKLGIFYQRQYDENKDKLGQRRLELIKASERLESWLKTKIDSKIDLLMSLERLDSLVNSYFYDIIRYKSFHGMLDPDKEAKVNFQKIFAYATKWILKEKPLYMLIDDLNLTQKENPTRAEIFIFFLILLMSFGQSNGWSQVILHRLENH